MTVYHALDISSRYAFFQLICVIFPVDIVIFPVDMCYIPSWYKNFLSKDISELYFRSPGVKWSGCIVSPFVKYGAAHSAFPNLTSLFRIFLSWYVIFPVDMLYFQLICYISSWYVDPASSVHVSLDWENLARSQIFQISNLVQFPRYHGLPQVKHTFHQCKNLSNHYPFVKRI